MNILTTVFLGDADAKVWFPNSVLATKPIANFYRSPDMGDSFDFIVSASTTAEKIGLLKGRIEKYVYSFFFCHSFKPSEIAKNGQQKFPLWEQRYTIAAMCYTFWMGSQELLFSSLLPKRSAVYGALLNGWCGDSLGH